MKTIRLFTFSTIALLGVAFASAQTADEIISKYVNAIGGKDLVSQISSAYMEGTLDVMGSQGTLKITQLSGKGYKQEIDVMGTQVVMCFTDSMGWQINPMSGNYSAETMPEDQYKAGKDQLIIGGPFLDYPKNGYQAELVGQETVGAVNAYKLKVTTPDSLETFYFFDPETFYLIRTVQNAGMMGQQMEIIVTLSNYQKTANGFVVPFAIETNYGGQFFLVTAITKVDVNVPVDPAVFAKPQ
jgi:hypothetical protein